MEDTYEWVLNSRFWVRLYRIDKTEGKLLSDSSFPLNLQPPLKQTRSRVILSPAFGAEARNRLRISQTKAADTTDSEAGSHR